MITPIVLVMDYKSVSNIDVLIYSIQKHIPNPQIYLITDKELDNYPDWVYKHAEIDLDISLDGRTKNTRWTKNMFLDLYIDIAFPELKKCIYLDYDTIVMQDISDLLLGDDWVIKVADHRNIRQYDDFRLNSGVIAFNFTKTCKELLEKCRAQITENTHDEKIIKDVFIPAGVITYVDKNYNVLAGCINAFGKPKVLHFLGMPKPWTLSKTYGTYFEYLNELEDLNKI